MVLLIGLVAISSAIATSSLTTSNVLIEETIHASDRAKYAAWAGIDELMLRLRARQNFGPSFSLSLDLGGGATASANISGDNIQKTVRSTGYASGMIRNLEVLVASSSSKAGFMFAVVSGTGGFELEKAMITGSNGTDGNVYSNGNVTGVSASSGSNGSRLMGSVWAVGNIDDVYIKKNAWATSLVDCLVGGSVKSPVPPTNCPYSGSFTVTDPPPTTALATVDALYWMNKAASGGIWPGDCIVGSGGVNDCTGGSNNLGNKKIIGNLRVLIGTTVSLVGPTWVKGNIVLENNVIVNTADVSGPNSVVIVSSDSDNPVANGKVDMGNNVKFYRNSFGAGPIFISENTSDNCTEPAIVMSNNATGVVLVALNGCIYVRENAILNGIVGKKIHLTNNSQINYDPSLAKAIIDPGSGGWSVVSVKEY